VSSAGRLPRGVLALSAAICLASGAVGGAMVAWLDTDGGRATTAESATVPVDAVPLNRLTVAPLVERVAPAVVNIAVLQTSPYAQNPLLRDP
jgi:S1-C subfamily serine protease